MSRLSIFRGDDLLADHVLMRAVVGLGRHPENDIVLDDRTLSRFHARVERRGDRYVVIDLGAQNGVHLNGQRITGESDLVPGDRIGLGRYVAIFDAPNASQKMRGDRKGDDDDGTRKQKPVDTDRTANVQEDDLDDDVSFDDADASQPEPSRTKNVRGDDDDDDPQMDDVDLKSPPKGVKGVKKGGPRPRAAEGAEADGFEEATTSVEAKPAQPTFVLLYNGLEVSRHPVADDDLIVGRSKQCDIVISLLGLSRKHARIFGGEEGVMVEDLGSQNGTWVNNQRIVGSRRLRHGDLLNFYDYGLLFLEDGDVQVGFPGAGFAVEVDEKERDILSTRETHQGKPPVSDMTKPVKGVGAKPGGTRPPVLAEAGAGVGGHGRTKQAEMAGLGLGDLDLGEGSYLGDDFEDEQSREVRSTSLLDEEAEDAPRSDNAASTAILDDPEIDDIANVSVEKSRVLSNEGGAFADADDFEGEHTGPDDFEGEKTSSSVEPSAVRKMKREPWPTDAELLEAMTNAADGALVTLEVTLDGAPYTQMPLSQIVTRVGTDARCEFSLPKSSGLKPWHLTLVHLGGHVVCYRASPRASLLLGLSTVEKAILRDGDELFCGRRVKIALKIR
jgi:pSer/pThr/pTyr-binding forkhead associated (FHA) protein